ncbi:MAG: ribosome maturation factor RimM [Oscillospiraceae bacterium]|jgi:16S rRNA processing protein RimM|nr:ribosome maturation factor RimM [Oscillospiraceae bacterium]
MKPELLEAGRIVNTHGVHGAVKIEPWANTPDFLLGFEIFYIDGEPRKALSARVQKNIVVAELEGVADVDGAVRLKNKIVCVDRARAELGEGEHFIADLIGLDAVDAETGAALGKITDVFSLPANNVYVVNGAREILIPAVPEFVREINIDGGFISFRLIEGL